MSANKGSTVISLLIIVLVFVTTHHCRFGCCEVTTSDQGKEFVNSVKAKLFCLTGTAHRVTSAYHPQSNGLTERFNQTLQQALVKVVNQDQTDWDEYLPAILFAYRTSVQKATKLTPFEVMICQSVDYNVILYIFFTLATHVYLLFRKPKLPIDMEYLPPATGDIDWDTDAIVEQAQQIQEIKRTITDTVKRNIDLAQEKDKMYFDKKHCDPRVWYIMF